MKNFWQNLPKPFFCLAPMEGVTDTSFRQVMLELGKPDVMFTEFTSVDGLCSRGFKHVEQNLLFTQPERPLVAQVWGLEPKNYTKAAKLIVKMGFDGIDINLGCPVRAVVSKGACSAMIRTPKKALEIIAATCEGVDGKIPVSVKTRIGFNTIITEDWASKLLDTGINALIIHGRTAQEMSKVPCHWDEIGKVVQLRDQMARETIIIGNGDVLSRDQGEQLAQEFGVDGVMIGRGVFHDPWVFNPNESSQQKTKNQKLTAYLRHIEIFTHVWGRGKGFERLKRFAKVYVTGFTNANEVRDLIMRAKTLEGIEAILGEHGGKER